MSESLESLKTSLAKYLADLDGVQSRMREYLNQRQLGLARTDPFEPTGMNHDDASAPEALRSMVARREELLNLAQSRGLAVTTLAELASRLDDSEGSLGSSIRLMKRKMEAMHYASLSHWISCQKSWLHYSQLVQLIANGGRKPILGANSRCGTQGGAILDANV